MSISPRIWPDLLRRVRAWNEEVESLKRIPLCMMSKMSDVAPSDRCIKFDIAQRHIKFCPSPFTLLNASALSASVYCNISTAIEILERPTDVRYIIAIGKK